VRRPSAKSRTERLRVWLPTSTDRFDPDFVASLKNGRILVVEYKGELWVDTTDTREKALGVS